MQRHLCPENTQKQPQLFLKWVDLFIGKFVSSASCAVIRSDLVLWYLRIILPCPVHLVAFPISGRNFVILRNTAIFFKLPLTFVIVLLTLLSVPFTHGFFSTHALTSLFSRWLWHGMCGRSNNRATLTFVLQLSAT